MFILVINSGSSSLKLKLFSENLRVLSSGQAERIGLAGSFFLDETGGEPKKIEKDFPTTEAALSWSLARIEASGFALKKIKKIGHRVVHGGEKFVRPTKITPLVIRELERLIDLAPLHNPANIAGIKGCLKFLPKAKNYAVFDTAFYRTIPVSSYLYPLPLKLYEDHGIRRYGFHGISHEYVARQAARRLGKDLGRLNLITCHLGSGCSMTAIKRGKAVDTSMGLTPLEGLMMSSRCGDIDPAIPLFLLRKGMKPEKIDEMMNQGSGCVGVCGLKDMRDVLEAAGFEVPGYRSPLKFTAGQKKYSKIALEMFIYRIRKYIGAYYAVLGTVDAIVFTAGIGERNALIRKMIMDGLPFQPEVLAIPTDEELAIAEKIT